MIYVYGSRLFGKVDVVPGLFHVQTKFGHFNYIPLIPMQSYVVLSHTGKTFRGVRVPLCPNRCSVLGKADHRGAAVIGGVITLVTINNTSPSFDWRLPAAIAIIGATLAGLLFFYKGLSHHTALIAPASLGSTSG